MSPKQKSGVGDAGRRKRGGLNKGLGLTHTICIATGALISSGLFVLPGMAHGRAGPAVIISYFLAGLLAAIGLFSVVELTTAMPKAGGDYFFISRALGSGFGTVSGLLSWFSIALKAAFALVGIGALSELVLPVDGRIMGGAFLAVFALLNIHGVRKAANLQIILAAGLLVLLVLFVAAGAGSVKTENFTPFVPAGWASVFSTAGFVFVSYGAAMKIVSMAEEIRDPGQNVPRGIGLSIIIVTLLYVAVVGVVTGVLPSDKLNFSLTPISDAAGAFAGLPGTIAMSLAAMLAFLTTANAGIMTASRYLFALSEDKRAPAVFSRLREETKAPWAAVLATSALLAAALFTPLRILVESASVVFVTIYILASLSVIVLREGKVQNYRPVFRAPLYPYLQVVGIAGFIFVLFEMGVEAFLIAGVLVLTALAIYWFYGRRRKESESAILHLIQRVTDRELITGNLEDELREIIRKRDRVRTDRLDKIVSQCPVLDSEGPLEAKEFFKRVANELASSLGMDPDTLAKKLLEREEQVSTVLRPGIAVPHMVVEANNKYEMLIARSKRGIRFPQQDKPVHAAFVLMTSRDNRDFHLRVLAGLAQIVQAPEFDKNWMNARDKDRLRDLLLIEKRMRIR